MSLAEAADLGPNEYVAWAPYPGFQEEVLAATEFEVFIGGAKGPGKTDCIIAKGATQVGLVDYKGLILRETFPKLEEVLRRAHQLYPKLGGKWMAREQQFQWYSTTAVSGPGYTGSGHLGLVKFGYCERFEHAERYQGGEWAFIGFDELANLADPNVVPELLKEIRCPNPEVRLQFMGSGNPGFAGQAWCKKRYVDPCGEHGERVHRYELEVPVFEDGRQVGSKVVTRHRRFIPGRVQDNPVYANDDAYMATLVDLPEERRKQMLHGDWTAGMNQALPMMDEKVHLVARFEVPGFWPAFGSLDWGFDHRWVFGAYRTSPEGRVYKVDTLTGRREYPPQIASRILGKFPDAGEWFLVAGRDIGNRVRAYRRSDEAEVPTRQEEFMEAGLPFTLADNRPGSRVQSLNNLRRWLKWEKDPRTGEPTEEPALLFFDTPGNRWCVGQLGDMVVDPKNTEDALKADINRETGEGGDDAYDETRMAMYTRPYAPPMPDATPAHHMRVHGRANEIMQALRRRQEMDGLEVAEHDESVLPPEMQSEPWGDVFG